MATTTSHAVGPGVVSRRTLAAGAAWSVPVIMAASAAPAMAASGCSGATLPGTATGFGADSGNALLADGTFASQTVAADNSFDYLTVSNFGFTIPAGSTIISVKIEVRWYAADAQFGGTGPDDGARFQIQAWNGASQEGNAFTLDRSGAASWPTASTIFTTSYDLTGAMPTLAEVTAATFGARIGFRADVGDDNYVANVDFVRITVCWR